MANKKHDLNKSPIIRQVKCSSQSDQLAPSSLSDCAEVTSIRPKMLNLVPCGKFSHGLIFWIKVTTSLKMKQAENIS